MFSRKTQQVLKILVLISLVLCLLNVFILNYSSGCVTRITRAGERQKSDDSAADDGEDDHRGGPTLGVRLNSNGMDSHVAAQADDKGFIDRIMDIIPDALKPRPCGPGDGGTPVAIPLHLKAQAREKFRVNQLNLVASELMSLDRILPDYRILGCRSAPAYEHVKDLPTTSVIIVFHNEAWSTLLRTVHSVINRSPRHLLKEIIMVDDASNQDHLHQKLDDYIATLPVLTRVLRSPQREGLIRAKLIGAKQAKGQVLTFLDAHCEATEGWLEPLLYEIYKDKKTAVCPIIDVISDDTFEYIPAGDTTWGGFNWRLNFRWYLVPAREIQRRGKDRTVPISVFYYVL